MKTISATVLLVGVITAVSNPAQASAGTAYVAIAVGYDASGAPRGLPYSSATAADAQQGAIQACRSQLVSCAPAGVSTQCIGIATGFGKWMSAEASDRAGAEAAAHAKLTQIVAALPLPAVSSLPLNTTAACAWVDG